MKIAIVFPKDSEALFNKNSKRTFGGANVQMYLIARELNSYEDVVTISFINPYDNILFEDGNKFNFVNTYREEDNIVKKILVFHNRINEIKPDIIIQRGLTLASCLLAWYCNIRRIKFVFMFAHDIEAEGKYQSSRSRCLLFQMLLKNSFLLVVQNSIEFDLLKNSVPEENLKIIKKGLEIKSIHKKIKKQYDAIWVARCEEWKNPELFVQLAAKNPSMKFLMICSAVPGKEKYYINIKGLAEKTSNLDFLQFVNNEEIYNLLNRSKIFVITSDQEGDWPMVVLEALSCKLPVISLNLDYNRLLTEIKAGFYCEHDVEVMNMRFRELLKNTKKYKLMSDLAFEYVLNNQSIKKNVKQLLYSIKNKEK